MPCFETKRKSKACRLGGKKHEMYITFVSSPTFLSETKLIYTSNFLSALWEGALSANLRIKSHSEIELDSRRVIPSQDETPVR
jgi:hypothetical protein